MVDASSPSSDDDAPWSPPLPSVASRRPAPRSRYAARVTIVSPEPREILCESATEANAAYALFCHPTVCGLREQPEAVQFVDADGVVHFHVFDFIAIHRDGSRTAVLVRPEPSAKRHNLAALRDTLAAQVPKSVADRFVLLTDKDLDRDLVHDAKLIRSARRVSRPDHDAVVLDHARRAGGPISVATLMNRAGLGGDGFQAIARLLGEGRLMRSDGGRLTHDSLLVAVQSE